MERTAQAGLDRLGRVDPVAEVPPRLPVEDVNDAETWSRLYEVPAAPVTALTNPVARVIAELTSPGDVLLETGCGSATCSAELALSGRTIELCDFSPRILERAREIFRVSGLPDPQTTICDITKPLPWPNGAVDVAWSSGVLEHWTDEELRPILRELARISRKQVISLVPFAGCLLYRFAKDFAERVGTWPYGREIPRVSLSPLFEEAGLRDTREWTTLVEDAPGLLRCFHPELGKAFGDWWDSLMATDPVKQNQGYLLVTVGVVAHR